MITTNFPGQESNANDGWYVKNGERVVGPVGTDLLLRGILHGRVPAGSMVKQQSWTTWRRLSQVREIAGGIGPELRSTAELIGRARDPGEALLLGLHLAVRSTRADVGLVHRFFGPSVGFVTCSFHGWALERRCRQELDAHDPVLGVARAGVLVLGGPNDSDVAQVIASRLRCGPFVLRGVAMVPVRCAGRLDAMIEIGRFDHPFREVDAANLRNIANALAYRAA